MDGLDLLYTTAFTGWPIRPGEQNWDIWRDTLDWDTEAFSVGSVDVK
jgi:hypothetical protein